MSASYVFLNYLASKLQADHSLQTNHFNIGSLMERGVRLIGNGQAPVHLYWEQLLKYIQEDKIHPYSMLSHRCLIDDLEQIYYMYDKKDDHMQKVCSSKSCRYYQILIMADFCRDRG